MRIELGERLQRLRTGKNVSQKELASRTRISTRYIDALERGDLDVLPGQIFIIGFVRSICTELEQSPEEFLELLEGCFPEEDFDELEEAAQTKKGIMPFALAALLLLVLIGGSTFLLGTFGKEAEKRETEETSLSGRELESKGSEAEQEVFREAAVPQDLDLSIYAIERTWLRIQTDSSPPWETTMRVGDEIKLRAGGRIMLHIGNAGGILLDLNGKRFGPPGAHGQVVSNFILTRDNL